MGKNCNFFHPGTSKTASVTRNVPINFRNLGIFHKKQGHSAEEGSRFSLASKPRKANFVNKHIYFVEK